MAPRRRTLVILIVFLVVCAVVGSGSLIAIKSADLATKLADVATAARALRADATSGDLQSLSRDIAALDDSAETALASAGDPVLAASDGLPVAGRYIHAARAVTQAVAGLSSAAQPLGRILPELAPEKLVVNGRYDVQTLSDLGDAVQPLAEQLSIAQKQIDGIDTDGLEEHLASAISDVRDGLGAASTLFESVRPLLEILPIVIGGQGEHTWFVGLQNLDEARGGGGIMSAFAIVTVNDGRIALDKTGSDAQLLSYGFDGTQGLPADFRQTWADYLRDWRDINGSANFPYTAELIRNGWQRATGEDVDGVLTLGQGMVQYLLAATGPLEVQGQTLDASTVTQFLSLGLYEKYPDLDDKGPRSQFLDDLVTALFDKIGAGDFSITNLATATGMVETADRVQAWAADDATQKRIVAAGLDGTVPTDYGPSTVVLVNNGGGNKLEQFLHTSVDYALGRCGVTDSGATTYDRASTVTVTMHNDAPASGLPAYVTPRYDVPYEKPRPGSNNELVTVYLPVGAEAGDASLDGATASVYNSGTDRDRTVLTYSVELDPGQSSTLVVHFREPTVGEQITDILGSRPSVITQPSLNPIAVTAKPAEGCRVGG